MQKTQGLLSLIARALGWVCCCCWTVGGSSQPSAIRCQSSANRSRAARVCSFSVPCAASKQLLARRRYSSPLLVTTKAPEATLQTRAQSLDDPAESRSGKMAPHGQRGQVAGKAEGASKRKPTPRAHVQPPSVKSVPAAELILVTLSRVADSCSA